MVSIHLLRLAFDQKCFHTLQRLVWYVPLHLSTFPSHISVTAFTASHIIGLFRSTVLLVMNQTRSKAQQACVLCATMMGCRWMVSIHLLRLFVGWHASNYASMTFTSLCGFEPHPPTVVGTHPLRFNDSFDICPLYLLQDFSFAHICRKLHCVHLPNISSGCFDQPSFWLWARRGLKRSKHVSSAPRWFLYAPPIAYRLVANCLFHRLWFFCAQSAVVRTLVQFDSINFAFYHLVKCTADPPHTLYT